MNQGTSPSFFVVGKGEVGGRLGEALVRGGGQVRWVTREAGWSAALDEGDPAPRIVAVREEQLAEVLRRFPAALRERLVLVQNGFLEAVLGDLGLLTRGLIYFTSKGDFFHVLCPSPFHGPCAETVAAPLARGGISTEVEASRERFVVDLIVKGIWNSVLGLPLAVHQVDFATYRERYRGELEQIAEEGAHAAGAEYRVAVDPAAAVRKILDTTGELGWMRGGAKALAWRNGAIARFGRRHGIPTPANDRLLRAAGNDPDAADND